MRVASLYLRFVGSACAKAFLRSLLMTAYLSDANHCNWHRNASLVGVGALRYNW